VTAASTPRPPDADRRALLLRYQVLGQVEQLDALREHTTGRRPAEQDLRDLIGSGLGTTPAHLDETRELDD